MLWYNVFSAGVQTKPFNYAINMNLLLDVKNKPENVGTDNLPLAQALGYFMYDTDLFIRDQMVIRSCKKLKILYL